MLNRREFMASSAAALTAALAQKADAAPDGAKGEGRNRQSGMAYRQLGRTGFMISEMVMGGNTIAPDNFEHVLLAMDMGLNYLDTAPAYGNRKSEMGYAKVIASRKRDTFFLNTKISVWDINRGKLYQQIFDSLPEPEKKKFRNKAQEEMERRRSLDQDYLGGYFAGQRPEIELSALCNAMAKTYGHKIDRDRNYKQIVLDSLDASLKRLGTDHVDLLMCPHGASTQSELLDHPEIFEAFEILKRKGRRPRPQTAQKHACYRCGRQLRFARAPQKRKGRGGAAPNGEEHAVFEAPERVRFARVPQKKQGKVRHLGVSAHNDPAGILEAAVQAKVYSAAMVAFNIVNRAYTEKAVEQARKSGLGVIAMKVARPVFNGRNNGTPDDPKRVQLVQDAVPGPLKVPQKAYLWALRNPNLSAVVSELINANLVKDNLPLAHRKPKGA